MRAFSMIEALLAQTIALIVIAGLLALFVPMVQLLNASEGSVESQVRLREASSILLRDVQGLGGVDGSSGALFVVLADGGGVDADRFRVFRRDHTVCTEGLAEPGVLAVASFTPANSSVTLQTLAGACPLLATSCHERFLLGRRVLVRSAVNTALPLSVTAVDAKACTLTFAAQKNGHAAAEYNKVYGTTAPDYASVFAALAAAGTNQPKIIVGSTFEYRVNRETLERSINGNPYEVVLPGVFDIQVVPAFDVNRNGAIDDNEFDVANQATAGSAFFVGAQVSLVTFSGAKGTVDVPPPPSIANRSFSAAPKGRRYSASTIFVAARNP